jgi:hypothetical protein
VDCDACAVPLDSLRGTWPTCHTGADNFASFYSGDSPARGNSYNGLSSDCDSWLTTRHTSPNRYCIYACTGTNTSSSSGWHKGGSSDSACGELFAASDCLGAYTECYSWIANGNVNTETNCSYCARMD